MYSACRLLLVVAFCCAGCDRDKNKSKKAASGADGSVAVGKLVITPPSMEIPKGSAHEAGEGFFEQQLEVLGGAEVRRQAEEILQKKSPEIKAVPVAVQLARMKGSNIVSIVGRGDSSKYRAALVDAIMEAYVNFVCPPETELAAKSLADAKSAEKNLQEAERAWTAFRLENDPTRLSSDLSAAERSQKRLAVAISYYEQELNMTAKLTLEQDIRRRQASPSLPSEMSAELAALVRTTLTVAEIAYLSGLKGTSAPVTEAARKEAGKDREERVRSIRKQLEIARDLSATTAVEIVRLQSLRLESDKLQASHQAAGAEYAKKKSLEKMIGGGLNNTAHPMISIIEYASKTKGA